MGYSIAPGAPAFPHFLSLGVHQRLPKCGMSEARRLNHGNERSRKTVTQRSSKSKNAEDIQQALQSVEECIGYEDALTPTRH